MKKQILTKKFKMNELLPYEFFDIHNFYKVYKVNKCQKSSNNNLLKEEDSYNIHNKGKNYYGKKRRRYSDYC